MAGALLAGLGHSRSARKPNWCGPRKRPNPPIACPCNTLPNIGVKTAQVRNGSINRPVAVELNGPLLPVSRHSSTLLSRPRNAWKRQWSGFFLLKNSKILRTNQAHRSAPSSRQRFDHPTQFSEVIRRAGEMPRAPGWQRMCPAPLLLPYLALSDGQSVCDAFELLSYLRRKSR